MREYTLGNGEVISEAELLRRAADLVDGGEEPVAAVGATWYGNGTRGRPLIALQLVRACSPWLPGLVAGRPQVAAAMRGRAEFLEHPRRLCVCGHAFGEHEGRPCLGHSPDVPCRTCRWSSVCEPAEDDPDCE